MGRFVVFWACRLAVSITWLKRGRWLLAGLVGAFVPGAVLWACSVFLW